MRELLETLDAWRADPGSSPAVGRAIVVRTFGSAPRPEGAVLLYADDGRIAGSRERRLCRGSRGRGDRPCPVHGACPGHPLRHQRRAGMGRRSGLRRHDRRARRAGRARSGHRRGAGLARGRWSGSGSRHQAPGGFATGRLRPPRAGQRRTPRARADRARGWSPRGLARPAGPRRRARRGRARVAEARHVPDAGPR